MIATPIQNRRRHRRGYTPASLLLLGGCIGLFFAMPTASAHGDDGTLTVTSAQTRNPGEVVVTVTVVFEDGDPADGAHVVATSKPSSAPVTLAPTGVPGTYSGTVPVGGPTAPVVHLVSTTPAAVLDYDVVVAPTTTASPTSQPSTPTSAAASIAARPGVTPAQVASPTTTAAVDDDTPVDTTNGFPVLTIAGVVLVGLALIAFVINRRKFMDKSAGNNP